MRTLFVPLILLSLCFPLVAAAQAPSETDTTAAPTVTLPEVQVEAARLATVPSGTRTTTLGPEAISEAGAQNAAELLEARTGLFIKRYGAGGAATVSLRGTSATQTRILVDGLRLSDPQSGQVDLSLLPTVLLEAVEVRHGAAGGGSGSLGGTVHLRTLEARGTPQLKASAGLGAYGERTLGAVASGREGAVSGVLAAEATAREGDFTYRNDALIPVREVQREDADRTAYSIYGRGSWHGEGQQIDLTGWLSRTERGLPGPANAAPGGARQWDDFARLWLTSRHRQSWGTLHLRALGQHTRMRYANPASGARDTSRTQTLALDAEANLLVGARWLLTAGTEAGYDQADLRGGIDRARLATFVRGTGLYGRWEWTPALRLDVLGGAQPVTALSPRLDVRVQPLAWDGLVLKAGAGRSFRAPTFNEQFWEPGGNPDLTAEQGWSTEVGTRVTVGGPRAEADAEVTAFTTRIDDQIVWYPSYVGPGVQVWRPDNFSRVVTRGLETSLRGQVQATPDVQFSGGLFYTLTDAENRSNPVARAYEKQLRYVPREQLKVHGSLGWRFVRLDVSGRLVSRRYLTSDETDALPAYQVVDAQLRLQHTLGGADVTLALALENALDADYAIISRYPMPPRHAHVRLTVTL